MSQELPSHASNTGKYSLKWLDYLCGELTVKAAGMIAPADSLRSMLAAVDGRQRSEVALGRHSGAFTLVEMLGVMALIIIVMGLSLPAFTSIMRAGDVSKTAYDIAGILQQARAYAMSSNTYVYVGIVEVDVQKDSTLTPQTAGTGRVAIAVVASRDGTRGYDVTTATLPKPAWGTGVGGGTPSAGANLLAISALRRFDDVHLTTKFTDIPNSGNLTRPVVDDSTALNGYILGNSKAESVTTFDWPLGSPAARQYTFLNVINFDPQGIARIQEAKNTDGIRQYIEIGLQQTKGSNASSATNPVVIQLDCLIGATQIYKP